nr:crustapain-like [Leptinotarsa decemlineata]
MKIFVLLCIAAFGMAEFLSDDEEWSNFKSKFNKVYNTPEEEVRRFEIFKDNLNHVREHQKKYDAGEVTYSLGINDFSDLTTEEFKIRYTGLRTD